MDERRAPVSQNNTVERLARPSVNQGRRRLGKLALATPVLVSLPARGTQACSVSGFISGNQSPGRGDYTCAGYGCTPGFWKNQPDVWFRTGVYSSGHCARFGNGGKCDEWQVGGTTLAQILTCTNPFGVSSGDYLLDILLKGVGNGNDLTNGYADVCHYIAAILNAASTPAYGSTVAEIQQGLCIASQRVPSEVNYYTTVLLARLNERGCMYDAHGSCTQGFVFNTASPKQCIPACPQGQHFDPVSVRCVPN